MKDASSFADALRALEPSARTIKRRERAAALKESVVTNQQTLAELLERFKVKP